MNRKTRILIADDHLVVRMGLAAIIGIEKDMTVVGEACDGREAIRMTDELLPDVVLMDLMMPVVNGADATKRLRESHPETKVVIITSYSTADDLVRADEFANWKRRLLTKRWYTRIACGALWFCTKQTGYYRGRPDNMNSPTPWHYNQVSDTDGLGAVGTLAGYPIRVEKLSNLIAGYACEKLGVPYQDQLVSQLFGTSNGQSAWQSWRAGMRLAKGHGWRLVFSSLGSSIRTEHDAKTDRLWPNPAPADNHTGMQDAVSTYAAVVINLNARVQNGVVTYYDVIPHIHLRIYLHAFAQADILTDICHGTYVRIFGHLHPLGDKSRLFDTLALGVQHFCHGLQQLSHSGTGVLHQDNRALCIVHRQLIKFLGQQHNGCFGFCQVRQIFLFTQEAQITFFGGFQTGYITYFFLGVTF